MAKWACVVMALGLTVGAVGCKKKLDEIKAERKELVDDLGGKPKLIINHVTNVMNEETAKRAAQADKAFQE